MLFVVWSPKGGSGTSVFAAALALVLAQRGGARLADLAGDQPAILGMAGDPVEGLTHWLAAGPTAPGEGLEHYAHEVAPGLELLPAGLPGVVAPTLVPEAGAALASVLRDGRRPTVVDAGRAGAPALRAVVDVADASLVVIRSCYLALRRGVDTDLVRAAAGIVLVEEPGRACSARQVAEILDRPVLARVPVRSAIARAVDAGTLPLRLPGSLATASRAALEALAGGSAGRAA